MLAHSAALQLSSMSRQRQLFNNLTRFTLVFISSQFDVNRIVPLVDVVLKLTPIQSFGTGSTNP